MSLFCPPTDIAAPRRPSVAEAGQIIWDVVIIGAGPAGGVAAAILAGAEKRVLLLEKSSWPREKVCGGCLNPSAIAALRHAGLGRCLQNGQPIHRIIWHAPNKSIAMDSQGGIALSRADLDAGIVRLATEKGCTFIPGVSAKMISDGNDDYRRVRLVSAGEETIIRARLVLACDGIAGTSCDGEPWAAWKINSHSPLGIAITCQTAWPGLERGAVHMHIGPGGYVGAVQLSDHCVHLAAALDPQRCAASGGPIALVKNILHSCGRNAELSESRLHGIGKMTRQRLCLGGHRVLALGDACGYVEPFTGEGIAWAIHSAIAASELVTEAGGWAEELPARWTKLHAELIGGKHRLCRSMRPLLWHPAMIQLAMVAVRAAPAMGTWFSHRITHASYHPAWLPRKGVA